MHVIYICTEVLYYVVQVLSLAVAVLGLVDWRDGWSAPPGPRPPRTRRSAEQEISGEHVFPFCTVREERPQRTRAKS